MATKKSFGNLTEADLKGKKVFLRADLNVPLDDDQKKIADDTSIRASVPTIKFLTEKGAKAGRPKGVTPKYSLEHLVPRLSELLEVDVVMARIAEDMEQLAASLPDGGVMLLDTPSFYEEEEKNDPEFAKKLSSVADIYVNDAFAHGALLEGKTLPGFFAFDINYGITSVMATKHGLPDKTSHHILIDDGVSSKLPVGKSHRTHPDDFSYEITSGGNSVVYGQSGQEGKVIHHHVSTDAARGRASTKVEEGRGLPGVFVWSADGSDVEGKVVEHI